MLPRGLLVAGRVDLRREIRQLVGGGLLLFGRVDFDAALEMGAVLDADARRINVADNGAILLDVHAATGVDVADHFAVSHHVAGMNFRFELRGGTNGELVTLEADGAVDDSVDLQIFRTVDLTLDLDAATEARGAASRRTAEFCGR